jgi:hypothetical protein
MNGEEIGTEDAEPLQVLERAHAVDRRGVLDLLPIAVDVGHETGPEAVGQILGLDEAVVRAGDDCACVNPRPQPPLALLLPRLDECLTGGEVVGEFLRVVFL